MLTEEAFVLVLALIAVGLLILGILDVFVPARPRYRRRRLRPEAEAWRRARPRQAPARAVALPRAAAAPAEAARVPVAIAEPPQPPVAEVPVTPAPVSPPPAPAERSEPAPPEPAPPAEPPIERLLRAQAAAPEEPLPSARCHALLEARQYEEVVTLAVAALGGGELPAAETARLWGLIGLARQEQGEWDGARSAFEEAIGAASPEDRVIWERHLGTLALLAGRSLLARALSGGEPDERVPTVRAAIAWLECGGEALPLDEALREALASARSAVWTVCEETAVAFLQRQQYEAARRLLREALTDPDCPLDAQATFRDLLSASFGGEIGQLTAEAIRCMQDGKEEQALATLDRAESLLSTIPEDAIPPRRRQELERRLWWGYTKLGIRQVEGGMWEGALEPLLRACAFQDVGAERQEETRGPLIRALEGLVEARAPEILRLADEGDVDGASRQCEELSTLLKAAMARGVTKDELAPALERTQQLLERLGRAS